MIPAKTIVIIGPNQANCLPINSPNDPIVPILVLLPMKISTMISGNDQTNKNMAQPIRKEPPPCSATIRGNLQIFPVPTAIPIAANINPILEPQTTWFSFKFNNPFVIRTQKHRIFNTLIGHVLYK